MAYNPDQTITWNRSTKDDGLLLEAEFNRIYANTNENRLDISKEWTGPGTVFAAGELIKTTISNARKMFEAVNSHTSAAAFQTDLDAGNWKLIGEGILPGFTVVKADGDQGSDSDFLTITAAIAAGKKNIFVAAPKEITVSDIPAGGPGVIVITTATDHNYSNGDQVVFRGTTDINGLFAIANVTATTFEITIISTTIAETVGSVFKCLTDSLTFGEGDLRISIIGESRTTCFWFFDDSSALSFTDGELSENISIRRIHFVGEDANISLSRIINISAGDTPSIKNLVFENCNFHDILTTPNNKVPDGFIHIGPADTGAAAPNFDLIIIKKSQIGPCKNDAFRFQIDNTAHDAFIKRFYFIENKIFGGSPSFESLISAGGGTQDFIISNNSGEIFSRRFFEINDFASGVNRNHLIQGNAIGGTANEGIFMATNVRNVRIIGNRLNGFTTAIELQIPFLDGNHIIVENDLQENTGAFNQIDATNCIIKNNLGELDNGTIAEIKAVMGTAGSGSSNFPTDSAGLPSFITLVGTDVDTVDQGQSTVPSAAANMPIPGSEAYPFRVRAVLIQVAASDLNMDMQTIVELPNGTTYTVAALTGAGAAGHDQIIISCIVPIHNYLGSGQAQIRLYRQDDDDNSQVVFSGLLL